MWQPSCRNSRERKKKGMKKKKLWQAKYERKKQKQKEWYFFFFFEKWILANKTNTKMGNHPIQKIIYLAEHTPARFEEKNIVLLARLRYVRLHYLADQCERKKYSKKSLTWI